MANEHISNSKERLIRFLKTGTDKSFFLPGKNKHFQYVGNAMTQMINDGRGLEAVECIKKVHSEKLFLKLDPMLMFLALACHSNNDMAVKKAAYALVEIVCETPVELFKWLKQVKTCSQLTKGIGRGLRSTVSNWYNSKDPMQVAEFVTRYKNVGNWSHKDVFRLCHVKPANDSIAFIIKVVCKGLKSATEAYKEPSADIQKLITYFEAVDFVRHTEDGFAAAMKLEEMELHKEHIPVSLLSSKEIWNSLLLNMPVGEVLSSLPALSRRGFLTVPDGKAQEDPIVREICHKVLQRLKDSEAIEKEKISPYFIYIAIRNYVHVFSEVKTYHHGKGGSRKRENPSNNGPVSSSSPSQGKKKKRKGRKTEEGQGDAMTTEKKEEAGMTAKARANNPELYDAIHDAFKVAVEKNTSTTGKSYLLAVKTAGSEFQKGIRGTPSISALEVMSLMATILKNKERNVDLGFFTATLSPMKFPSELDNIIEEIYSRAVPDLTLACDPAAPVTWALEKKKPYDVFLVMSDGAETLGEDSPASKLLEYRQQMNLPDTKMVLCGLAAPKLDFAQASGMLDIGGFDATVPSLIHQFITGKLDTL
ncbi:RNA-binding protein RO60-like isoform X2 [Dreissena polymorpha]|uniref:TROVE domain-containing protein n=1 Tax=Dreissena polymorpha TaxID=45954 RepID=A0A9D4FIS4_DREPO|nr:RNA-binding protein RO60-like isoform X2 [Dreissena polymorpha]KAH3799525.1 hypothetical protein DPMN_153135 [Dreissena polymorpha]